MLREDDSVAGGVGAQLWGPFLCFRNYAVVIEKQKDDQDIVLPMRVLYGSPPRRLLKKSPVDARQGGKWRKSAVYMGVHEPRSLRRFEAL
jgi:hypothetical protein